MRNKDTEAQALLDAIDLFESREDMVYAINTVLKDEGERPITRQAVESWLRIGIPSRHARVLEQATGQTMSREQFRPDLYA